MNDFEVTWAKYRARTELALENRLPEKGAFPGLLSDAMRYSCLGGGKRFRAMLVYAAGEMFNVPLDVLDVPAAAVEMIHAFSLVHDDLPAMDDDDLRRGQLTCHKAFDEATAILTGDAAQTLAFELLASDPYLSVSAERRLQMVTVLAKATGYLGMAGGQSLDMLATNQEINKEQLTALHKLKTGALIRASCQLGALSAEKITESQLVEIDNFATAIGLAFQIVDDILDVTATSEVLGKASGADEKMCKSTYVTLLGIDQARLEVDALVQRSLESAARLGDNSATFQQLAHFVANRQY